MAIFQYEKETRRKNNVMKLAKNMTVALSLWISWITVWLSGIEVVEVDATWWSTSWEYYEKGTHHEHHIRNHLNDDE